MTAQHWLDIIPAIPLARGVPVVRFIRHGIQHGTMLDVTHLMVPIDSNNTSRHVVSYDEYNAPQGVRVDLDDPQGFGYALRWAVQHSVDVALDARTWGGVNLRHLTDQTTDADRIALARALAEVSR